MASCSTYLANKILDHVFGKTAFDPADTLYLALFSVAPNSEGSGGTELAGDGYARIEIDNDTTTWADASARQKLNDIVITLPAATADWDRIVAWKLLDADAGGNVYTFGLLVSPVEVKSGEEREVPLSKFIQNLT